MVFEGSSTRKPARDKLLLVTPPPERVKVLAMTGVEVVCSNVFPLKLVLSKICFSWAVNASASL